MLQSKSTFCKDIMIIHTLHINVWNDMDQPSLSHVCGTKKALFFFSSHLGLRSQHTTQMKGHILN